MMKKYFSLAASLLFFAAFLHAEKYALIVAIGDYPDPGRNLWSKISSGNDAPIVKTALLSQGFSDKNITLLMNAAATKDGIKKAFDDLIAKVSAGDIVVIHFSSHGEQLEDDNKDEVDGLDEAIVPYGAVYSYDKNKFKELAPGYFRDDEFGEKVTLLRNKLKNNGDVLVMLDACHSGTGTRGMGELKPRGALAPMVSNTFDVANAPKPDENGVFKDNNGVTLNKDAATYVVISGAQAKEFNYECYADDDTTPVGSLSYAFTKAMANMKEKTSYRGLFAEIENIMRDKAPRQKPVLEGDGIDRTLFGGDFVKQQPYFTIKRWLSDTEFILNAGSIAGLTVNSVVGLYPVSTIDPAGKEALNKGTITSVTNFDAHVTIEKPDTLFPMLRVFLTESAAEDKLKLDIRNINGTAKKVTEALKGFDLVEINSKCDLYLDTTNNGKMWALKYPVTGEIFIGNLSIEGAGGIENLKSALKQFSRYRYLQAMDISEPGLEGKLNLVFLKNDGSIDEQKMASRMHNGRLELKENDEVYLQIINTGEKNFFINIVDMQPDGKINPILPHKNEGIRPEDCEVRRYDTLLMRSYKITIGPPYGEETFKVFLSRESIDLEDILVTKTTPGTGKRGNMKGLEKVFADSEPQENGTRGGTGKVSTDQNGTIFNVNFGIVK